MEGRSTKAYRRYACTPSSGGRVAIYFADFRALATVAKHPRRLAAMGIRGWRRLASELAREVPALRSRAVACRKLGIAFEPIYLESTRGGDYDHVWITCDDWRGLMARVTAANG